MVLTIPEMHSHLENLNRFFVERTTHFTTQIQLHPGSYTGADYQQFAELIEEIRTDAMHRITEFFNRKHNTKTDIYDEEVTPSPCRLPPTRRPTRTLKPN